MKGRNSMNKQIEINGSNLTLPQLIAVARGQITAVLAPDAKKQMMRSYNWVQKASLNNRPIYGVNTGFGSLARLRIPASQSATLSRNLIRSHAAGVGPQAPKEIVRATMLLRANALAKGVSGCRPALVEQLLAFLNNDLTPCVPLQGSCGSSGDLAPLAHLGLVMIGDPDGSASIGERILSAPEALELVGLKPLSLEAKDGLAITNGAQLSTALTALALYDASEIVLTAEMAAAMSLEALLGVSKAFDAKVHQLRPYKGALETASNIRSLIDGSSLIDSVPEKVQDAYSLRCTPQVLGAARDSLHFVCSQISIELNAATDNPLIIIPEHPEEDANYAFSAGMFHGEPTGLAADQLRIAISEVASLSERRLYRLTTGNLSQLLPPGLIGTDRPMLGMMVPQTTAAALVSENKALGWPASLDSIPTCEDQEDHIAMSTVAARRARSVTQNSRRVVAIELLCAAHALRFRRESNPDVVLGKGTEHVFSAVNQQMNDFFANAKSSEHTEPTIGEQIEHLSKLINSEHFGHLLPRLSRIVPSASTIFN
ncbi:MAG: histidine ammonia-lyase [Proteobacteria bacterium]|nr:histidine ammonia-lyase [Pseudomonadota bacterium]